MGLGCTMGCTAHLGSLRSFRGDSHHICPGCQLCTQPVLLVVSGCDNCINSGLLAGARTKSVHFQNSWESL